MKKKMITLFLCSALITTSSSPAYATCFTSEPLAEDAMFSAGFAQEEEASTEVFTSLEEAETSKTMMAETDIDAVITDLQIVNDPDRVEYYYGLESFYGQESFDLTGLQIEVTYSDNTRQLLEYSEYDYGFCDSLGNEFTCNITNMDGSDLNIDVGCLDKGDYLLTVEYDYDFDISDTTIVRIVDPANIPEMTLDENGTYVANVKASGTFACTKFVPAESVGYVVSSDNPENMSFNIYDSSYEIFIPQYNKFQAGKAYYFVANYLDRNTSIQFLAKKAPAIKSVEIEKEPTRKWVYQYLENKLTLLGGRLKITYEDGTSESIETGDTYGLYTLRTQYGEDVKFSLNPDGTTSNMKPGTYDAYLFIGDYKTNTVIKNVKVKSLNEIPIINGKGEKSVSTYGNNSICMRFKTGKTTKYLIQSSFHRGAVKVTKLGEKGTEGKTISVLEGKVCTLKPNTTYLLSFSVDGAGNYLPSKAGFIVTPGTKSYDFSKVKISGKTTFTYTGKEIKPNFTIKYGKKLLKKDKDYSISYYNNKNIGNALAIVNGKGIYFRSISKPFYITLKTPSIKVANSGSRAIKVSWSKIPFADGYIVERSSGKKWSKVATVNGKTYFTDNKVKKGTTYKYRVQAYCKVYDNMRSYSLYSSVKTIKR